MQKALKILFAILVVITVLELTYYIFLKWQNGDNKKNFAGKSNITVTPTEISSVTQNNIDDDLLKASQFLQKDIPPRIQYTLMNLGSWVQRDVVISSVITTELEGKIVGINTKGGEVVGISGSKIPYAVMISLISGKDKKPTKIYYKKEDFSDFRYLQVKNGKEVSSDPDSFKINDKIRILDTHDFKNDKVIHVKIIKL